MTIIQETITNVRLFHSAPQHYRSLELSPKSVEHLSPPKESADCQSPPPNKSPRPLPHDKEVRCVQVSISTKKKDWAGHEWF